MFSLNGASVQIQPQPKRHRFKCKIVNAFDKGGLTKLSWRYGKEFAWQPLGSGFNPTPWHLGKLSSIIASAKHHFVSEFRQWKLKEALCI